MKRPGPPGTSAFSGEESARRQKESGAYCTPPALVDYLLARTLGRLLQERTLERRGGQDEPPLTVLDPACGTGVFLVAAYRLLLGRTVAIQERQNIVLRHLYGLDVDPSAVEATKLALAEEMLSEAAWLSPADRYALLRQAVERMADNIKCGDALIGPDYRGAGDAEQTSADSICPFDWEAEFPDVMRSGGFDLVVGNPPYLSYSGRHAVHLPPSARRYLMSHYRCHQWPCAHSFFIERATRVLARRMIAFVVPGQVGHLARYASVRELLAREAPVVEVRYWGEGAFAGVVTPALTFVADKQHQGNTAILEPAASAFLSEAADGRAWALATDDSLWRKLCQNSTSLGKLVADVGVHTGNCAQRLLLGGEDDAADCEPILEGRQISRYACQPARLRLRLGYRRQPGDYFTVRPEARYASAPFLVRQTASYPIVGPRRHATYFRNSLLALYSPDGSLDVRYLVGLLNSRLMRYAYQRMVPEASQKAFPQVKVSSLRRLPIRWPDLPDARDRARHDAIVSLVDRMLALHEHSEQEQPQSAAARRAQVAATDREIDNLVFAMYDLTAEEIALVERATAGGAE